MTFTEFEQLVGRCWQEIPELYKGGVDALVVERDAKAHPRKRDIYTLGECVTETYVSDFGGPETTRSSLVLYYGSFRRLAATDPAFDWDAEVWETLTHELQHHLESLAAEDDLEDVDAAAEENFRRIDGELFDPLFYVSGVDESGGWYRVDDSWFFEVDAPTADGAIRFDWEGHTYRVEVPAVDADYVFITVSGVDEPPEELCIVVHRHRAGLRSLLRRGRTIAQVEARGERVEP
jgi:hypothetical protein